ncbi:helix-turn-helix domain-containing protein [Thermoactinospora rubra]|uniref:helix-turn-helix domain-containing protein n=1 Tax=Thermoactinospora rubra TaxID=1088767 RepID=UPI00197EA88F|nr:helix-turn-helix domain-containing protein [Thermoactinospora rubra]
MRYPQGGGLTTERRAFRERIRLRAAEMFAGGVDTAVIAKELRVSVRSVQRWRHAWQHGGARALRSNSLSGIAQMLRRHGWSHQIPARRAVEGDPQAVDVTWPGG